MKLRFYRLNLRILEIKAEAFAKIEILKGKNTFFSFRVTLAILLKRISEKQSQRLLN